MIDPRRAFASPLGVLVVIAVVLTLVSPWTVGITQIHTDATFGFENPLCWLIVLALVAAVLATNSYIRLAALLAAEVLLLGWFAWVMWVATTAQYSGFDFRFIGIDLIGPGWFEAALGLLAAAAIVARHLHELEVRPGREAWLLSAVPGMGLVRLGHTARGVVWAVLVSVALVLASTDSPMGPLFQPIGGHLDLPAAPPTRAPEWILLGAGLGLAAASLIDTYIVSRRRDQHR